MMRITDFHAHVYFDAESEDRARHLCERARDSFGLAMGRMHRQPVGPHPRWSCQLTVPPTLFGEVIAWLALERDGLTIFVHPNTGEPLPDHRDRALWMGELLPLELAAVTPSSDRG